MLTATDTLRPARPDDAAAMASLINIAGEGLPAYFWKMIAPDAEAFATGRARAMREEGSFSWTNAHVIEADGSARALLITYPISDAPDPVDPANTPSVFLPLEELESQAPGSFYVNVLATEAGYRKRGFGSRLLEKAIALAGKRSMSIIVSDANENAMRLYKAHGFAPAASRPIVKADGWQCDGKNWILMLR